MSGTIRIHEKDLRIAIDALMFRQDMLDQIGDVLRSKGEPPSQQHIRLTRETNEAFTNLLTALKSARAKAYVAEPTGVPA